MLLDIAVCSGPAGASACLPLPTGLPKAAPGSLRAGVPADVQLGTAMGVPKAVGGGLYASNSDREGDEPGDPMEGVPQPMAAQAPTLPPLAAAKVPTGAMASGVPDGTDTTPSAPGEEGTASTAVSVEVDLSTVD